MAQALKIVGASPWHGFEKATNEDPIGVSEVLGAGTSLGLDSAELAWVIEKESGWDPGAWNRVSDARGLLQWIPSTRSALNMAPVPRTRAGQAPFVKKYFEQFGRIPPGDVYLAVFYPRAIGKPNSYIIAKRGSKIWEQNRGLRRKGGGAITAGSVRRVGRPLRVEPGETRPVRRRRRKKPNGFGLLALLALFAYTSSRRLRWN